MDKSTFQIFDQLTSNLDNSLSISDLTKEIEKKYGSAYYANIYNKLQKLKEQDLINLKQIGRTSLIELNFSNYFLLDFLAEMDIEKKRLFFKNKPELVPLLVELEQSMSDVGSIKSFGSINIERKIKLNKIELLFLLKKSSNYHEDAIKIFSTLLDLQKKHNIQIIGLIINQNSFSKLMMSDEINPVREALPNFLSLFCPQLFWGEIRNIKRTYKIQSFTEELNPLKISQPDLMYNLNRFGYKEFGWNIEQGKKGCIEYIITSLLLQNDARLFQAIPVIISKNSFDSNVLIFLAQRFQTSNKLLGLLRIIKRLKPKNEIEKSVAILEALEIEEVPADEKDVLKTLRLYGAT